MTFLTTLVYGPFVALLVGAFAGLIAGRYLEGRNLWLLPGALIAVSLYLIVRLTVIGEGQEESAFALLAWLTGGVFPALFTAILGTLGGRALSGRRTI